MARSTFKRLEDFKARTGIYAPRKPRHVRMAESLEKRRAAAKAAAVARGERVTSTCPAKRAAALDDALLMWAYGCIGVNDALALAGRYHGVSYGWLRDNWPGLDWSHGHRPARNRAEARWVLDQVYG